jgi:hypothetical protein
LRLPASGVVALGASLTAFIGTQFASGRARRVAGLSALLFVMAAAVAFAPWARDETAWRDALNYRFVAPFVFVPFAVGASVRIVADDTPLDLPDAALALGHAGFVALVVLLQSAGWVELRRGLEAELARKPRHCFPMWAIPECSDTALHWWPTPAYAIVLQGRTPSSLVLASGDCKRADFRDAIQVNPWYLRPRDRGWFDLSRAGCGDCRTPAALEDK